jgi:hypothetical protein
MIEESDVQWGTYRLKFPATRLEIVLDRRQETITFFTDASNIADSSDPLSGRLVPLTLSFKSFVNLERDLSAEPFGGTSGNCTWTSSDRSKALMRVLEKLGDSRYVPASSSWQEALGSFAFLLLRYGRKHRNGFEVVAQKLLAWVAVIDAKTAWHISFDHSLSFEHRYRLLRDAQSFFTVVSHNHSHTSSIPDLIDVKDRELFWWSRITLFEAATEWDRNEGHHNLNARRALGDGSTAYLQMLKDEPHRRDLARFLSECGTDIETEVKRVLFSRERTADSLSQRLKELSWSIPRKIRAFLQGGVGRPGISVTRDSGLVGDEVIRRTFFIWFLKRFDLKSARKLVLSTAPARENVVRARRLLITFNVLAVILILIQLTTAPAITGIPPSNFANTLVEIVKTYAPWLWGGQVLLQLVSLLLVLLIAPTYFRLLMPRALFGSLLAWATIVFTALPDWRDVKAEGASYTIGYMFHVATIWEQIEYSLLIGAGIFLLSFIFIAYAITQFISSSKEIILRAISTSWGLFLGSFFWSMIFVLPAKYVLESNVDRNVFMFECFSMLPIAIIGTPVAVLFGLIIQLIWDDASLTEPLGEPL